jgi:phospholipid/cholesterol/gamma-HCH transport system ATP-binding protein
LLSVKGLEHWFGPTRVLEGINLDVAKGEVLAIMGSSGGGKTTLLKCVSGLVSPTKGEIVVDGVDVAQDPEEARRRMGMVFQYSALFDYLNVRDNVLFGVRRLDRLKKRDEPEFVAERLREVGLEGKEDLMPSELSGGMRKRVGLARALAMEPKVLLFDEPTSGLDPVTAYSIDHLIAETRERLGMTCVVVSHDVTSVFRVADTIAFLEKGRMVFHGTPEEFRRESKGAIGELVEKARAETLNIQ